MHDSVGDHLVVRVPNDQVELTSWRLWELGAVAVGESVDGTFTTLTAGFGSSNELSIARATIVGAQTERSDPGVHNAWKTFVEPYVIAGRFTVVPAWCAEPVSSSATTVVIEPGNVFGLAHSTTRLCIEALIETVQPGHTVLDVGCGSGVLSVVAAALGAEAVTAIDRDPAVVSVVAHNAKLNRFEAQIHVAVCELSTINAIHDVVVANLGGAQILVELLDEFQRVTRPSGVLILGGMLDVNVATVETAFAQWRELRRLHDDGWNVIVYEPPGRDQQRSDQSGRDQSGRAVGTADL